MALEPWKDFQGRWTLPVWAEATGVRVRIEASGCPGWVGTVANACAQDSRLSVWLRGQAPAPRKRLGALLKR